ncbi:MAG: Rieske (2Fe-2S) protein [Gammaproteobacteria bacterium]
MQKIFVVSADRFSEKEHLVFDLLFDGNPGSALVFRFQGRVFGYLNRCVHIQSPLDCKGDQLFDDDRLRCSRHGLIYQPETGEAVSALCQGKRLTRIRVKEISGSIFISDSRARSIPRNQ